MQITFEIYIHNIYALIGENIEIYKFFFEILHLAKLTSRLVYKVSSVKRVIYVFTFVLLLFMGSFLSFVYDFRVDL